MSAFPFAAILALGLSAAVTAQPSGQRVDLLSYSYAPKPIRLAAGRPVTLTFVNRSGKGHDFTAKRFFANSTITAGAAPGGKIELSSGQSRSVTLIPRAGTYNVHCSHFLHTQFGMTNLIVVN